MAHPHFVEAGSRLVEAIRRVMSSDGEAETLLLTGYPGTGKTTLLKSVARHFPAKPVRRKIKLHDGTRVVCGTMPVLRIRSPVQPRPWVLASDMLMRLHCPSYGTRRDGVVTDALLWCLRGWRVRAVAFDDAQNLLDRRGRLSAESVDLLHRLQEQGIVVILVGLPRLEALLDGELGSHWSAPVRLDGYRCADAHHMLADSDSPGNMFLGLLQALCRHVELDWAADVDPVFGDGARKFLMASHGRAGPLKRLLLHVIAIAEERGVSVVDRAILEEALGRTGRHFAREDPFAGASHVDATAGALLPPRRVRSYGAASRGRVGRAIPPNGGSAL